jgi:hypothetical protein
VVAKRVEWIDIQPGPVGRGQALAKFKVKDFVAEALALEQISRRLCKGNTKKGSFG